MSESDFTGWPAAKLDSRQIRKLNRQVKPRRLRAYLRAYASLPSRHYQHSGNRYAVQMLRDDLEQIFERIPDKVKVSAPDFEHEGLALCNVEARLKGTPQRDKRVVVICAHLDCTGDGEPGYQQLIDPAPGADDDASGIAAVLLAAHAIERLRADAGVRHREIRFVLFNAEEAAQAGSAAYVAGLPADTEIAAVFDVDMIGYRSSRNFFEVHAGYEPATKNGTRLQDESLQLARVIADLRADLAPGLKLQVYPGDDGEPDPAQGFGDHTSFHRGGFPACLVTENFFTGPGSITLAEPNPHYHLAEDRPEHLDFEYAAAIARVVAGAAWYVATAAEWPPAASADDASPAPAQ